LTTFESRTLNSTKLHQPGVIAHLVVRPCQVEQLDRGVAGPLTLGCASIGAWQKSRKARRSERASAWCAANGYLDETLYHALTAHDRAAT
jgi:hypothetical protein